MTATIIEEQNCKACGVDIREGALFCYNCGGSVTDDEALSDNNAAVSDAWFSEEIAEESPEEKSAEAAAEAETKDVVTKKSRLPESTRLRSAAALRRKSKTFQKKKVEEVVWEEYEDSSNSLFVVVAVVLALLTAAIFLLAIYLK
jgi:uncharacterized Zn finger protein (UPF0148 family)